jgi:hypothetical protein
MPLDRWTDGQMDGWGQGSRGGGEEGGQGVHNDVVVRTGRGQFGGHLAGL